MRYREILASEPYRHTVIVLIDAMEESHVRRDIDHDPDLMLLDCDSPRPCRRAVRVAAKNLEAASRFADRWNRSFDGFLGG